MFERRFEKDLNALKGSQKELWQELKKLVESGEVFPAIRKDELHFYYKGGTLFKFSGSSFKRNRAYLAYGENKFRLPSAESLDYAAEGTFENRLIDGNFVNNLELFMAENKAKFSKDDDSGTAKERKILSDLYPASFLPDNSEIVVLDIEVRINDGSTNGQRKCDLVLLNNETSEIMFVEGKISTDSRMRISNPSIKNPPEVVLQVENYSELIKMNESDIEAAYVNYTRIIKGLFKHGSIQEHSKLKILQPAKLLVYGPVNEAKGCGSRDVINKALGKKNVLWHEGDPETLSLKEIWDSLSKGQPHFRNNSV